MLHRLFPWCRAAISGLCLTSACAQSASASPPPTQTFRYTEHKSGPLHLDLYLPPPKIAPVGLIVWVHGGAWRSGSRSSVGLLGLISHGWAVASVDYRLSTVAPFPAQIHDLKASIRYLRAHAAEHGFPSSRFVVAGSSAGGHLAALVGLTNGVAAVEGQGPLAGVSSAVQGTVVLYGASNLGSILSQSTPHGLSVRQPALRLLLGTLPKETPEITRLASPVTHVDSEDPPLLWFHGDQDLQMPINQAHELHGALKAVGSRAELIVLHGAGHGGSQFSDPRRLEKIATFLQENIPLKP